MKIESIKKQILFHVEISDEDSYLNNYHFIRDGDGNWYISDYNWEISPPISPEKSAPLEEAYMDYVERTFNGCA